MRHFAVSAVGRDRPGIVSAVSAVLLAHDGNIEDSQMTILRGHFTMVLIVSAPGEVDAGALRGDLERVGEELGLEAVSVGELEDIERVETAPPSRIVTVYGVDHPGIVHAVSSALASRGVNITDLTTRLVGDMPEEKEGEAQPPLYAMMLEVAVPPGMTGEELETALRDVAAEQGVEVTVKPLEQDVL